MKYVKDMIMKVIEIETKNNKSLQVDKLPENIINLTSYVGYLKCTLEDKEVIAKGFTDMYFYSKVSFNNKTLKFLPKVTDCFDFLSSNSSEKKLNYFLDISKNKKPTDFISEHEKELIISVDSSGFLSLSTKQISGHVRLEIRSKRDVKVTTPYKFFDFITSEYLLASGNENFKNKYLEYLGCTIFNTLEKYNFNNVCAKEQSEIFLKSLSFFGKLHNIDNENKSFETNMALFLLVNKIYNPNLIDIIYSKDVISHIYQHSLDIKINKLKSEGSKKSETLIEYSSLSDLFNQKIYSKSAWSLNSCNDIIVFQEDPLEFIDKKHFLSINSVYKKILKSIKENILPIKHCIKIYQDEKINIIDVDYDSPDTYYKVLRHGLPSLCNDFETNENPYHYMMLELIEKIPYDVMKNFEFIDKYIIALSVVMNLDELDFESHQKNIDYIISLLDNYMSSNDSLANKYSILKTLSIDAEYMNESVGEDLSKLKIANILLSKIESYSELEIYSHYKVLKTFKNLYLEQLLKEEITISTTKKKALKF